MFEITAQAAERLARHLHVLRCEAILADHDGRPTNASRKATTRYDEARDVVAMLGHLGNTETAIFMDVRDTAAHADLTCPGGFWGRNGAMIDSRWLDTAVAALMHRWGMATLTHTQAFTVPAGRCTHDAHPLTCQVCGVPIARVPQPRNDGDEWTYRATTPDAPTGHAHIPGACPDNTGHAALPECCGEPMRHAPVGFVCRVEQRNQVIERAAAEASR